MGLHGLSSRVVARPSASVQTPPACLALLQDSAGREKVASSREVRGELSRWSKSVCQSPYKLMPVCANPVFAFVCCVSINGGSRKRKFL